MFALILWLALGWRAGVIELLAELAIGLAFVGGGGGKRFRRSLRDFARKTARLRTTALKPI